MRRALTAIIVSVTLGPAVAAAQAPPTTTEEEPPIPDPNVPDPNLPPDPAASRPAYRYEKREYPRELVLRPLTLAAEQAEVAIDMPFVARDGHPTLHQILRGAFGVTVDLQLGVTYTVGLERFSAEGEEKGFEVGKAVSLDAAYTIIPGYLAAQLRLAFYADPDVFGLGLILGVPFKITIGREWAVFGGADLVSVKLKEFAVDPADPASNLRDVDNVGRGVDTDSGSVDFTGGVAYQAKPNLAVWGTIGVGWPNFDTNDQPFALFTGLTFSPRRFWDIGARVGFLALDEPAESFSVGVFAALRI
jgi:hypothetical protein